MASLKDEREDEGTRGGFDRTYRTHPGSATVSSYPGVRLTTNGIEREKQDSAVSGIESGIMLMNDLKASINHKPDLVSSQVAVLKDRTPVANYLFKVMYEKKTPGKEWLLRVFFVRYKDEDYNALTRHIGKTYRNLEDGAEVNFQFKDDKDRFIELFFDDKLYPKGWSFRHHKVPLKVKQTAIDRDGSMSPPRFPEFLTTITATPGEGAVKELYYPVTMQGIKCDIEKINIVLTMEAEASFEAPPTTVQPTNASKQFRRVSDRLTSSISHSLFKVSGKLNAEYLITEELHDEMINGGDIKSEKAAKLVYAIQTDLKSNPNPETYLHEVCSALKDVGEKQITEIVNELERRC